MYLRNGDTTNIKWLTAAAAVRTHQINSRREHRESIKCAFTHTYTPLIYRQKEQEERRQRLNSSHFGADIFCINVLASSYVWRQASDYFLFISFIYSWKPSNVFASVNMAKALILLHLFVSVSQLSSRLDERRERAFSLWRSAERCDCKTNKSIVTAHWGCQTDTLLYQTYIKLI